MPDLREWYLAEVDGRLRGRIPTGDLAILLRELETHLYEAHDNVRGSGATDEDAQRAAIESLGHPAQIARAELKRRSPLLPWAKKAESFIAFLTPLSLAFVFYASARIATPFQPSFEWAVTQNQTLLFAILWIVAAWITGRVSLKPFLTGITIAFVCFGLVGARLYPDPYHLKEWPYTGQDSTPAYLTQTELKAFRAKMRGIYEVNSLQERQNRTALQALNKVKSDALSTARGFKVGKDGVSLFTTFKPKSSDFETGPLPLSVVKTMLMSPTTTEIHYNWAAYELETRIARTKSLYLGDVVRRKRDTIRLGILDQELNLRSIDRASLLLRTHFDPVAVFGLIFLGMSYGAAWASRKIVPANRVTKGLSRA